MYISILGRQPALGAAELERLYGADATRWLSSQSMIVSTDLFNFEQLGGSQKAGRIVSEVATSNWHSVSQQVVSTYLREWAGHEGKITLGISAYGFGKVTVRDVQKTGIILKQKLRAHGVSLRLIPNTEAALNTAASHHNKLGLSPNKVELLIVCGSNGKVIIAQSVGSQNITALAARDQARPYTDAFVGMLPPKLARMMINLTGTTSQKISKQSGAANHITLLDPFCGTGVVLQEALLLGLNAYGTDLSEKMVDYSTKNLDWLGQKYILAGKATVEHGDAMTHKWRGSVDLVACETYLGQPFSAPPSLAKLTEVRGNCNHIIGEFLRNISPQITPGTSLCIAVPAWRDATGRFTHLPLIGKLDELGFDRHHFSHINDSDLLYYRENQVVARELLVLVKR
ncbi:MAG: hypothetical protein WBP12_05145 [Candidatus Saccharimonas sp.]